MMERLGLEAEVVERRDAPNAWGVEAIDAEGDGAVLMALFSGPDAKERALEYARAKFRKITLT